MVRVMSGLERVLMKTRPYEHVGIQTECGTLLGYRVLRVEALLYYG